jgi:hypothetical protein
MDVDWTPRRRKQRQELPAWSPHQKENYEDTEQLQRRASSLPTTPRPLPLLHPLHKHTHIPTHTHTHTHTHIHTLTHTHRHFLLHPLYPHFHLIQVDRSIVFQYWRGENCAKVYIQTAGGLWESDQAHQNTEPRSILSPPQGCAHFSCHSPSVLLFSWVWQLSGFDFLCVSF